MTRIEAWKCIEPINKKLSAYMCRILELEDKGELTREKFQACFNSCSEAISDKTPLNDMLATLTWNELDRIGRSLWN